MPTQRRRSWQEDAPPGQTCRMTGFFLKSFILWCLTLLSFSACISGLPLLYLMGSSSFFWRKCWSWRSFWVWPQSFWAPDTWANGPHGSSTLMSYLHLKPIMATQLLYCPPLTLAHLTWITCIYPWCFILIYSINTEWVTNTCLNVPSSGKPHLMSQMRLGAPVIR